MIGNRAAREHPETPQKEKAFNDEITAEHKSKFRESGEISPSAGKEQDKAEALALASSPPAVRDAKAKHPFSDSAVQDLNIDVIEQESNDIGKAPETTNMDEIDVEEDQIQVGGKSALQRLRSFPLFSRLLADSDFGSLSSYRRATFDEGFYKAWKRKSPPSSELSLLRAAPPSATTSVLSHYDEHASENEEDVISTQMDRHSILSNGRATLKRYLPFQRKLKRQASIDMGTAQRVSRRIDKDNAKKDYWKGAIERLRTWTLPGSLLRWRHKRTYAATEKSIVPLLSSSIAIPFYSISRDENGRRGIPIVMEGLQISLRDDHFAEHHTFNIELQYGSLNWTIHRSLVDFYKLHSMLNLRHLQGRLPSIPKFPSQLQYAIEKAKNFAMPLTKISDVTGRLIHKVKITSQRRKALEEYLLQVFRVCNLRVTHDLFEFLELSGPTALRNFGHFKGKEGYVKKCPRDIHIIDACVNVVHRSWESKWFAIRDSYIVYYDSLEDKWPHEVLLLDQHSRIDKLFQHSQNPLKWYMLSVNNQVRKLRLQAESERLYEEWVDGIQKVITQSPYCQPRRFDAFAPVRADSRAQWFVDGSSYFGFLADAINKAERSIYIQGWWLTPELYLKRPVSDSSEYRLDRLLENAAIRGVQVHIIVYKEIQMALGISSSYTKSAMQSLHPNIRVMRFPDHVPGGILYWALHDKVVVIDEDLAFVGGLDLCLGRYDTSSHSVGDNPTNSGKGETWVGQDYSNPLIADFKNVENFETEIIDKSVTARMGWHDVHCCVYGQPARDLGRHFVQRWNYIKYTKSRDRDEIPYLLPPPELNADETQAEDKGSCEIQVLRSVSYWSTGVPTERSIHEAYLHLIRSSEHYIYIENQFFVSSFDDKSMVQNEISSALTERIIRAHRNGQQFRVFVMIPLLPAFENDSSSATIRLILHYQQMTIFRGEHSIFEKLRHEGIDPQEYISFCSLRTYGSLGEYNEQRTDLKLTSNVVSEIIYIHSKMMIVDDRHVIIGSANINDRSQIGHRDSEIAVLIKDNEEYPSLMNGAPYKAGKFAIELRLQLFREHLGLSDDSLIMDPLSDYFFHEVWIKTAKINTAIYHDMFNCVPDDSITSWDDYLSVTNSKNRASAHLTSGAPLDVVKRVLSRVKGNLVQYPIYFLNRESLGAIFPAKEMMLSIDVFV